METLSRLDDSEKGRIHRVTHTGAEKEAAAFRQQQGRNYLLGRFRRKTKNKTAWARKVPLFVSSINQSARQLTGQANNVADVDGAALVHVRSIFTCSSIHDGK
jgi:hypothetical protein